MFLFKIFKYVSIKHLDEDNEELGGESWEISTHGIEQAFELFLKKERCLLIFWGPFWRREIVVKRNGNKIRLIKPRKKGG